MAAVSEPFVAGQARVGFIGLGVMGLPMAKNLADAGYALVVFDAVKERADLLPPGSVTVVTSAAEVARGSDVVVTMLPDSSDVLDVTGGPDGLLAGGRAGLVWVDMSSISPTVALDAAGQAGGLGIECLDAPVSGGEKGAVEGTLSIMVGGPRVVFDRCLPIFERLGGSVAHIGEAAGSGQVTKLCNQVVVGCTIAAVAEALVLAKKAGVDPTRVREALLGGFAGSKILELHGQRMLERTFAPGFRTTLHQKDMANALAAGRSYSVPLALTAVVAQLMAAQAAAGDGNLDHSALVKVYEQLAGQAIGAEG